MNTSEKAADQTQKTEQEKPESQEQGQPEAKEQGAEQGQPEAKEQGVEQGQPEAKEQGVEQGQPEAKEQGQPEAKEQKEGAPEEGAPSEEKVLSLMQVLDFLKQSNLINLDTPLKKLVDQVQKVQPDPSADWGIVGDSGHWALVWKRKNG